MMELRMVGIDVFVSKEELRNTLALAAECGGTEVQAGEIGSTRDGLVLAWVPGWKGCTGLVHCKGRSHRQEALAVL